MLLSEMSVKMPFPWPICPTLWTTDHLGPSVSIAGSLIVDEILNLWLVQVVLVSEVAGKSCLELKLTGASLYGTHSFLFKLSSCIEICMINIEDKKRVNILPSSDLAASLASLALIEEYLWVFIRCLGRLERNSNLDPHLLSGQSTLSPFK